MMTSRCPLAVASARKMIVGTTWLSPTSSSGARRAGSSTLERGTTARGRPRLVDDRREDRRRFHGNLSSPTSHRGAVRFSNSTALRKLAPAGPSRILYEPDPAAANSRNKSRWDPRRGSLRGFSSDPAAAEVADAGAAGGEGDDAPETVPIVFVEADGTEKRVEAPVGRNLLEVAHANHVELEGACGGELACSTCHLIFPQDVYDTLPPMEEDEVDMLDLAFEVTDTSRLGCQIKVRRDMAGMKVRIPDDGF